MMPRIRRRWYGATVPVSVIPCSIEVPSWVRIKKITVVNETREYGNYLAIYSRAKWWCFWRVWDPMTYYSSE